MHSFFFVENKDDLRKLKKIIEEFKLSLSDKEIKTDKLNHVRKGIASPEVIARKLIHVMKVYMKLDEEAQNSAVKSGMNVNDISSAHIACPLITKKVMHAITNQIMHILNGCVSVPYSTTVQTGTANYCNTGHEIPTHQSLRGTSRCEALHSVCDSSFCIFKNYCSALYDVHCL